MTPETVRQHAQPDVLFVGGTKEWKRKTTWNWCHEFPRVHVGRVNYERWLCMHTVAVLNPPTELDGFVAMHANIKVWCDT